MRDEGHAEDEKVIMGRPPFLKFQFPNARGFALGPPQPLADSVKATGSIRTAFRSTRPARSASGILGKRKLDRGRLFLRAFLLSLGLFLPDRLHEGLHIGVFMKPLPALRRIIALASLK